MKGEEIARVMSDFVNSNGCSEREMNGFVDKMTSEHRTLQQLFTRLCFKWILNLAKREHFDERNKASVETAKEIVKAVGEDKLRYLPYI